MVKRTQTIRRQIAKELFDCVGPFCGIGAERVKTDSEIEACIVVSHKEDKIIHLANKRSFW